MPASSSSKPSFDRDNVARQRLRLWRQSKDRITRITMRIGGLGVIIAIVLIFFYLLHVVYPLFESARMQPGNQYGLPDAGAGQTLHLAMEEQAEVGVRFTDTGKAVFFDTRSGQPRRTDSLPLNAGRKVTSFATGRLSSGNIAYGLDNGRALLARHEYKISYPENRRHIEPRLSYPFGRQNLLVDPAQRPLKQLAIALGEERATLAALNDKGAVTLLRLGKDENPLADDEGEAQWMPTRIAMPALEGAQALLMDPEQRLLYVAQGNGEVSLVNIGSDTAEVLAKVAVTREDNPITRFELLTGGISVLAGLQSGEVQQWFPVRRDGSQTLARVRRFEGSQRAVSAIITEQRRKGFAVADESGQVSLHHATAQRTLLRQQVAKSPVRQLALSPRADALLAQDTDGQVHFLNIHNEHPEVSWSVLWGKVWYESYPEAGYTWQSSSASNDFEPKYSLVPLAFGTLKAAFYAMLFAVPLAIMGAIYAAYFMAPQMRSVVKPTIEIMEALPTVILGFLAGLWLAPMVESHLPGVFSLLIILPPGIIGFAWLYHKLPRDIRNRIPEGWQAAMLVPVLLLLGALAMGSSEALEQGLFNGNMRNWLSQSLGMDYDQRNSLVVGIAMGVAVIPTIFSITEDAIFSVPRHLTFGSLALGATTWQTLVRVVILTASPGIFSAVMIGLGRAVGETMIVLMATGNTPVMDLSIFQGMRTLSANVAVEMPESEVASTHYRVLFLAALVLFMFTFIFNTVAEIIRQRLRRKYSSL